MSKRHEFHQFEPDFAQTMLAEHVSPMDLSTVNLQPAGCDQQGRFKTRPQRWPGMDDPPEMPLWPAWLVTLGASWGLVGGIIFGVFVVVPWLRSFLAL